jgi:hypothetical protein
MFKLPTGPTPERISLEYTPLQAGNWKADMKLFLKTCTNIQVLSIEEQTTLIKRYVLTSMWPLVELERGDEIGTMIKKSETLMTVRFLSSQEKSNSRTSLSSRVNPM